jgi:hypothetical protein
LILIPISADIIGKEVLHNGYNIGVVADVKPNMENGRRYAFIKPHDVADDVYRIPLDELDLVS